VGFNPGCAGDIPINFSTVEFRSSVEGVTAATLKIFHRGILPDPCFLGTFLCLCPIEYLTLENPAINLAMIYYVVYWAKKEQSAIKERDTSEKKGKKKEKTQ